MKEINKLDLVRKKLHKYRVNKVWINNRDALNDISPHILKKAKKYQDYVSFIDNVFECMDKDSETILKKLYIEKLHRTELPFATSTFYWKHKKAVNEFLLFIGMDDHN